MNSELNDIIDDAKRELNRIKDWISENSFDNKVLYLNSYAVIKASGTIELVMKTMIFNRMTENASQENINYITRMILDSYFNPTTGKIENLLQDLNSDWKLKFHNYVKDNFQKKSDLNSLIGQRNTFSHGSRINMSIDAIINDFNSGTEILEELFKIINS